MNKIEIEKYDGKMYDFSLKIMGRTEVLLKTEELLKLHEQISVMVGEHGKD